ncbi:FAD dependent oxidoreductase [Hymenopellis radicata]|nr:FAD dependent oxidoreductase [Hymenopellis radicata]
MSFAYTPNFHLAQTNNELVLERGQSSATPKNKRVLVVGGGVTGFTTAWALLDAGYKVTLVSDKWADPKDRIASQIAGALWEWPPAVCGKHTDVISLEKSKDWCMTSYHIFDKLQEWMPPVGNLKAFDHGVQMGMANFFFVEKLEEMADAGQLDKWNEIQAMSSEIKGVKRDPRLIHRHQVNKKAGVVDSYQHMSPMIDTDAYMRWLQFVVTCKGASLYTRKVEGDLLFQEGTLLAQYDADIIINATGLGSHDLAGDKSVYPLRGALVRVVNDGKIFPKVTEALVVTHDNTRGEDEDIVFIVPRNDNILILGGLVQPHEYNLDLKMDSPEIQRMRTRCNNFVPGLENAEYDPDAPLVQGLRPFRGTNVRIERETRKNGSRIIHSYGHGGSGFTLSFGCARDVLGLVYDLEKDLAAEGTLAHL